MHGMGTVFRPEHHHATHHQSGRHGDGVKEKRVDQIGKNHADHGRRQKGQQQVKCEVLCGALARQANYHIEDLAAVLPYHGQDGAQLDDDIEGPGPFPPETDQVGHNDLMAGT